MTGRGFLRSVCLAGLLLAGPAVLFAGAATTPRALDGQELLKIGDLHAVQNHLQEAMPYYQRALTAFRAQKNRRGEASALMKVAEIWERQGRHAEALAALDNAVPIWGKLGDDRAAAQARLSQGRVSEALGRREEAREAYDAAGTLFRKAGDRQGAGQAGIHLGMLLLRDDQRAGLALLQSALEDARKRKDSQQELQAVMALGDYQYGNGEAEARTLYLTGLTLAEAERNTRAEADFRMRLARLYGDEGVTAEATPMARRALGLYQTLKQRHLEADAWALLGHLSLLGGETVSAIEQHERALGLYRALRDREREAATLINLALAYDRQSLKDEAAGLQDKAIALLQSLP